MKLTTVLLLLCAALALAALSAEANRGPYDRDASYQRGGGGRYERPGGRDEEEKRRPPKKPCHEEEAEEEAEEEEEEEVAQYEWKCVKVCEPKEQPVDKEHKDKDDKNKKCSTKKWNHDWDRD